MAEKDAKGRTDSLTNEAMAASFHFGEWRANWPGARDRSRLRADRPGRGPVAPPVRGVNSLGSEFWSMAAPPAPTSQHAHV